MVTDNTTDWYICTVFICIKYKLLSKQVSNIEFFTEKQLGKPKFQWSYPATLILWHHHNSFLQRENLDILGLPSSRFSLKSASAVDTLSEAERRALSNTFFHKSSLSVLLYNVF